MRRGFIFGVFLCLQLAISAVSANSTLPIVINEIHCTPALKYQESEFIELFNYGEQTVSISGWRISGAVDYTVPENTLLPAKSYLVLGQNEHYLRDSLGLVNGLIGTYKGRLKKEGETIILRNQLGKIVDKVSYQQSFPWPTVGGDKGYSHQLIEPTLDNALGGYWRGGQPTPGHPNQTNYDNINQVAPAIDQVRHLPKSPQSNMPVLIEAHVNDNQAVKIVQVLYQTVDAGSYIRKKDKTFEKTASWHPITMNDEGRAGDKKAGDGIYTVTLPDSIQKHRRLVRYRVWAKDNQNNYVRVPYADDPKLNFAYFVYDGLPDYCKHSLDSLPSLPVCHLIANENDINYYIFKYSGNVYKTTGTVVYNGQVYDHVGFRSRGFKNRHKRTKRNIKINFNRGNPIEVLKDSGKPYKYKRDKLVLSGNWLERLPNTHGLAESVLYRMFTLQEKGQASYADYLHLRVIDSQNEQDTFGGDFWGIYLNLENYDKDYIKSHRLPEGNIYSYKPFARRHMSSIGPYALKNEAYKEWNALFNKR
ncbi:MAG: lamin tail domain-containing protein, partial [Saprospiraceae bacterium]|nr:lamin tail domain-containing protein [Saprospiraceae bacterium]